jgi:hypothetical protein
MPHVDRAQNLETRGLRPRKARNAPVITRRRNYLDFGAAREEVIRVAAYYLAQKRGFAPGMALDD